MWLSLQDRRMNVLKQCIDAQQAALVLIIHLWCWLHVFSLASMYLLRHVQMWCCSANAPALVQEIL